jgi:hypothetical protein
MSQASFGCVGIAAASASACSQQVARRSRRTAASFRSSGAKTACTSSRFRTRARARARSTRSDGPPARGATSRPRVTSRARTTGGARPARARSRRRPRSRRARRARAARAATRVTPRAGTSPALAEGQRRAVVREASLTDRRRAVDERRRQRAIAGAERAGSGKDRLVRTDARLGPPHPSTCRERRAQPLRQRRRRATLSPPRTIQGREFHHPTSRTSRPCTSPQRGVDRFHGFAGIRSVV